MCLHSYLMSYSSKKFNFGPVEVPHNKFPQSQFFVFGFASLGRFCTCNKFCLFPYVWMMATDSSIVRTVPCFNRIRCFWKSLGHFKVVIPKFYWEEDHEKYHLVEYVLYMFAQNIGPDLVQQA